jgi:transposase
MWALNPGMQVFVKNGPTDMRRSFNGLALMVAEQFAQSSLDNHLFVFFNRKSDTVKLLYWDRNGYCLWSKRLERGVFCLPAIAEQTYSLSLHELNLLLEGIELTVKRHRPAFN